MLKNCHIFAYTNQNNKQSAMKKYLVILSAVLASHTMSAQFTFGIDGGLSVPSSNYGASTLSSSGSTFNGSAKLGSCYDGYVGFKFIPLLGGMIQYGANMNSINTSDWGSNVTASKGSTVTEYLIGPFLHIKISNIKIEAKLLGGLVSSTYPTISQTTTFSGVSNSFVESFSTGNAFGYCAGVKVKYMVVKIFGIGLGLDYVGSDVKFNGVGSDVIGSNSTSISSSNKMNIGILQATLGLSIDL
jgi:hypothetical protein